jgi:outer membrane lipoprotein-sorting protein
MKLPVGNGTPASDGAEALQAATAACQPIRTLSAEVAVSGALSGRRVRGRLLVGFAAPASARIEAVAPAGAPLFIFVATGEDGTLVLPRDARFIAHAPAPALLDAVAGVPFGPADLRSILSGCGSGNLAIKEALQLGSDWRRVQVMDSSDLYLRRDGTAWQLVAVVKPGRHPVRVEYSDFAQNRPRSVRITESPSSSGYDLLLKLSQVEIDTALDADVFQVQTPRSAVPITIDELRQSGPLGSRPSRSE